MEAEKKEVAKQVRCIDRLMVKERKQLHKKLRNFEDIYVRWQRARRLVLEEHGLPAN